MRLNELDLATLDDQQRVLYDRIGGKRGHVRGPFLIWLRSPGLCDKVEALGSYLRWDSSLPKRISELSILVTARYWDAPYSWAAHAEKAIAAGVDAQAVEELAQGRTPNFKNEDETIFYEFTMALLKTHQVSDELYERAFGIFGERGLVDIIGAIGNFSMLALCLNTFRVPLRPEQKQPFPGKLPA